MPAIKVISRASVGRTSLTGSDMDRRLIRMSSQKFLEASQQISLLSPTSVPMLTESFCFQCGKQWARLRTSGHFLRWIIIPHASL
ncbi:hypothetical protein, partial [Aquabacterium sp.]|uniref:hypothetical protein n=1 Tax=Aquabacterium sp. TaxID=1872578 RepID=UPI0035AE93A3